MPLAFFIISDSFVVCFSSVCFARLEATLLCRVLEFERNGPVAQLDRASDFGSEGWGFDSLRGRHFRVTTPLLRPRPRPVRMSLRSQPAHSDCPASGMLNQRHVHRITYKDPLHDGA
jgi:hypothetical protein